MMRDKEALTQGNKAETKLAVVVSIGRLTAFYVILVPMETTAVLLRNI